MQAAAGILFGNGDDQTKVGLGELLLGFLVALGDLLRQLHLLLRGKQGDLADLLEVHTDRVVQVVFGSKLHRIDDLLLGVAGAKIHRAVIQLELRAEDLDAHRLNGFINLFDLVNAARDLGELGVQLAGLEHALLFALCNQSGDRGGKGLQRRLCGFFRSRHSALPYVRHEKEPAEAGSRKIHLIIVQTELDGKPLFALFSDFSKIFLVIRRLLG